MISQLCCAVLKLGIYKYSRDTRARNDIRILDFAKRFEAVLHLLDVTQRDCGTIFLQ